MSPPSSTGTWRLVLRVDGSAEIGHGHLARSLALGETLVAHGADPILVARAPLPNVRIPVVQIPPTLAPEREGDFLASLEPRPVAVIADLFRPTQSQVTELAKGPWRLVFLDDGSAIEFDADLLINPNINQEHVHRRTPRTKYVRGAQALILRPEFQNVAPRISRARVEELLVCMGGSDPDDATGLVVRALHSAIPPPIERVTIVLGPGYQGDLVPPDDRFVLVRDVHDMSARMQAADVGVLAAGNLLHEALAVGLPSILIDLAPAQAREASFAHARGAALWLGGPNEITAPRMSSVLAQLHDCGSRSRVSARARELVQEHDVHQLASRVACACGRQG